MNLPACVASVERAKGRTARIDEINKILAGNADVGTGKKPNRGGIDLLHQRALFTTELAKRGLWPA